MRTIKFRAQDIASNKWLFGDIRHHKNDVCLFEQGGNKGEQVKPETVGQFTGLTDKDSKEIYEGDVIRINLTDGSTTISSVVWNRRGYCGYWGCDIDINHGVQLGLIDKVRIEVIGNIHDNPELLEEGGKK